MSDTSFYSILIIALGLSADCFAVALSSSIAAGRFTLSGFFRFPISFGIFQALMIVIGWLAGRTVIDLISSYDHWLAFGLLAFIGGKMLWEAFGGKDEAKAKKNINSWFTLLALSVATSIDALAVGLSFAFLKTDILLASITVGLTAFIITVFAQLIGNKVGALVGKRAEIIGGLILIGIGVKILLEHLL
ncbi:MAG: manganese efflux pump [Dehalococcoidales bacterium]|nr:manganese efflux pump [Dehalococcoidales bacterium]